MTKAFDGLTTSEPALYRLEEVAGKGIGCIATQDIQKGCLILRETPQLLVPEFDDSASLKEKLVNVIKVFLQMSPEDKENYLNLYNMYTAVEWEEWSDAMKYRAQAVKRVLDQMRVPNISQDLAYKVSTIYDTNCFHNGVCIKMSRINHACRPSARYLWNEDTNTRDIRALRKIREGEEITVSYLDLMCRAERRAKLKADFNFFCNCTACDETEEQAEEEAQDIEKYKNEQNEIDEINDLLCSGVGDYTFKHCLLKRMMQGLKKMYRLARKLETIVPGDQLLDEVLEDAYQVSCKGAFVANRFAMRSDEKGWRKDAVMFAKIGLEIATTLYGEEHSETRDWKERTQRDLIAYLEENGCKI